MVPTNLRYTRSGLWLDTSDPECCIVGVTHHELLSWGSGGVDFILPNPGQFVKAEFASIYFETTVAISEIKIPVTGLVEAVNTSISLDRNAMEAFYTSGWMIRIRVTESVEEHLLISAEDYMSEINIEE